MSSSTFSGSDNGEVVWRPAQSEDLNGPDNVTHWLSASVTDSITQVYEVQFTLSICIESNFNNIIDCHALMELGDFVLSVSFKTGSLSGEILSVHQKALYLELSTRRAPAYGLQSLGL